MESTTKMIKRLQIISISAIALLCLFFVLLLPHRQSITLAYNTSIDANNIYYSATTAMRTETTSFSYVSKSTESYSINTSFPNYYNTNGDLKNSCANVAGSNIIGYYDRYFDTLIPNSTPGIGSTKYIYYPMSKNLSANQALIEDLYIRMQTNVHNDGCTQQEYKNGLSSYVQSKNHSTTFYPVMSSGNFDLNKAITQLRNGNPLSLYLSGYSFTNVTDNGNTVTYIDNISNDNHIAIAYGYEKIEYYGNNNSIIRSEIYLKIATGIKDLSGVYIVNHYGKLNDVEAVNII